MAMLNNQRVDSIDLKISVLSHVIPFLRTSPVEKSAGARSGAGWHLLLPALQGLGQLGHAQSQDVRIHLGKAEIGGSMEIQIWCIYDIDI